MNFERIVFFEVKDKDVVFLIVGDLMVVIIYLDFRIRVKKVGVKSYVIYVLSIYFVVVIIGF